MNTTALVIAGVVSTSIGVFGAYRGINDRNDDHFQFAVHVGAACLIPQLGIMLFALFVEMEFAVFVAQCYTVIYTIGMLVYTLRVIARIVQLRSQRRFMTMEERSIHLAFGIYLAVITLASLNVSMLYGKVILF
jgi:hypothetical protein